MLGKLPQSITQKQLANMLKFRFEGKQEVRSLLQKQQKQTLSPLDKLHLNNAKSRVNLSRLHITNLMRKMPTTVSYPIFKEHIKNKTKGVNNV